MSQLKTRLANYGFDYSRFRFGTRTGIAACLALLFAWSFGLEHPQWAAMTVWGVSQPTVATLRKAGYRARHADWHQYWYLHRIAGDAVLLKGLGLTLRVVLCVYGANLLHGDLLRRRISRLLLWWYYLPAHLMPYCHSGLTAYLPFYLGLSLRLSLAGCSPTNAPSKRWSTKSVGKRQKPYAPLRVPMSKVP